MIRVNYEAITGKILGYYPYDIDYAIIPEPYLIIEDELYLQMVGKEDSYRIKNGEVIDISDSEEYKEEAFAKKFSSTMTLITTKADYSSKWAVLEVGSYSINANWLAYFETLKRAISQEPKEIMLRVYELVDEKYYMTYISLSKKKTSEFLNNSIATIQEYQDTRVPTMMAGFIEELQTITDLETLEEFIPRINYGITINENETVVPIRI